MAAKWLKSIPCLWPKQPKNHTLWRCTYLYSPYKGVPPPPPGRKLWLTRTTKGRCNSATASNIAWSVWISLEWYCRDALRFRKHEGGMNLEWVWKVENFLHYQIWKRNSLRSLRVELSCCSHVLRRFPKEKKNSKKPPSSFSFQSYFPFLQFFFVTFLYQYCSRHMQPETAFFFSNVALQKSEAEMAWSRNLSTTYHSVPGAYYPLIFLRPTSKGW